MRYCDISGALDVYARGGNVTEFLRGSLGKTANDEAIIEIAYDLQAGSYVDYFEKNRERALRYVEEISGILKPCAEGAENVLDVGTGECTTLAGVAERCFGGAGGILGCDISWSRLYAGLGFARRELPKESARRLTLFAGNLFTLPLRNKSVDVVWTSHALEPNGGRERQALAELFRVARNKVCLFEPCYEENSEEGRRRMDRLGYVRGLPDAIRDLGGVLERRVRIESVANPLNPTYAFVIAPPPLPDAVAPSPGAGLWACPSTGHPLTLSDGFVRCERAGLVYPVLRGIPVLREDAAVLASAWGRAGLFAGAQDLSRAFPAA